MPRVLVAESAAFPAAALSILEQLGPVRLADLSRADLLRELREVNVLWVRLRHRIDKTVMDTAPELRWIATPTTGLTHIDVDEANRRGIGIVCLRGQVEFLRHVRATAEITIALMLALIRRLPEAVASVAEGVWNRDLFRGSELYEKTAGLIGYGRLGRIVGRYLHAFGCHVLATDTAAVEAEPYVELVSLPELLRSADIVSLHADYRPENRGFFNADCFARMRAGSYFINTARGELVDEQSLVSALQAGHLAGAAVDVLCGEPAVSADNSLVAYARKDRRLLITPHIGGCTSESLEKAERFLAELLVGTVRASRFESDKPFNQATEMRENPCVA